MSKNEIKEYIINTITIVMWIGLFYSLKFIHIDLVMKSLVIAVICFIVMIGWKEYNIKRFGSLRRRQFPKNTDISDLVYFFKISEDRIREMQNSKIIILEENLL